MSEADICDELLTLICAGHGTSAATLAVDLRAPAHPMCWPSWSRPKGGSSLRRATIMEAMRVRTVIDLSGRKVRSPGLRPRAVADSGRRNACWCASPIYTVIRWSSHTRNGFDPSSFPRCARGTDMVALRGGSRRCIGVGFALAEMDVIVRTVLLNFEIHTDSAPDENAVEMFALRPRTRRRIMMKASEEPNMSTQLLRPPGAEKIEIPLQHGRCRRRKPAVHVKVLLRADP